MKKFKAAFCNINPESINRVYTAEQKKRIAEITELMPEIITPENFDSVNTSDVEVLFSTWGMMNFSDEQLKKMPKLKAVFYGAGATEYFAWPLMRNKIKLSSAWKANAIPVAEFTLAQIILSMKNYFSNSWHNRVAGPGCYGETVALIGDGAISCRLQKMLKNYNLKVIVVPTDLSKTTIPLEEVFKTAYVISNHLPNSEFNHKVITKEMFASMRKGATFINTGRGPQIDEAGLIEVMKQRPDLTALLDVLTVEPPAEDSELYKVPNIRMTGHIAGSLNDEVHRMADYMIDEYIRFANDEPLQYEVIEEYLLK